MQRQGSGMEERYKCRSLLRPSIEHHHYNPFDMTAPSTRICGVWSLREYKDSTSYCADLITGIMSLVDHC